MIDSIVITISNIAIAYIIIVFFVICVDILDELVIRRRK